MGLYRLDFPVPKLRSTRTGTRFVPRLAHTPVKPAANKRPVRIARDIPRRERRLRRRHLQNRLPQRSSPGIEDGVHAMQALLMFTGVGLLLGFAVGGHNHDWTPVWMCGAGGLIFGVVAALIVEAAGSRPSPVRDYREENFRARAVQSPQLRANSLRMAGRQDPPRMPCPRRPAR